MRVFNLITSLMAFFGMLSLIVGVLIIIAGGMSGPDGGDFMLKGFGIAAFGAIAYLMSKVTGDMTALLITFGFLIVGGVIVSIA